MDNNLEFIKAGKTGCLFATIMARNPEKIGWHRLINPGKVIIPDNAYIVSFIFEGKTQKEVIQWAVENGMYEEKTSENTVGLRFNGEHGISWVQYFGKDSHVKTRQAPNSELLLCVKLPTKSYFKVGFSGVLHLAHASVSLLSERVLDRLWDSSHTRTKKILGHTPTINEAAKTSHIV